MGTTHLQSIICLGDKKQKNVCLYDTLCKEGHNFFLFLVLPILVKIKNAAWQLYVSEFIERN